MAEILSMEPGGYKFIKGVFQYSGGVAALPQFEISRARFDRALPLAEGFAAVEAHLRREGRPLTALCACELRSPEPFTEVGFDAFNRVYAGTLERWGILRDGLNPVARTNVCPEVDKPAVPSLYAFSYTVACTIMDGRGTFVASGSGEAPEGAGSYRDHAIRPGDTSREGLQEKARWVLSEMERRMAALGFDWSGSTGVHLYTVHDVHPFVADEIARRGAMRTGLSWHFSRPPVQGLEYEMDVRGILRESVLT